MPQIIQVIRARHNRAGTDFRTSAGTPAGQVVCRDVPRLRRSLASRGPDSTLEGRTMESTAGRPAIDIASERPRPGLALFLAVLSVPGSTIAWALPPGASGSACRSESRPSSSPHAHVAGHSAAPAPGWQSARPLSQRWRSARWSCTRSPLPSRSPTPRPARPLAEPRGAPPQIAATAACPLPMEASVSCRGRARPRRTMSKSPGRDAWIPTEAGFYPRAVAHGRHLASR